MKKSRDYIREFRGFTSDGGVCRVRLYEDETGQEGPVVVISDLPENDNTSVTNIVEVLAAEVAEELGVVGADTRFVEHIPRTESQLRNYIPEEFDFVTFSALQDGIAGFVEFRRELVGGVQRPTFGDPDWRHTTREEVAELLGEDIGGEILPEAEPEPREEGDEPVEKAPLGPERAREYQMDLSLEWSAPDGDVLLRRIPDFERGFDLGDHLQSIVQTNVAWSVVLHSETGFEYGYSGQGPADLSLNILNMFCPPGEDGHRPVRCFEEAASWTAWSLHQEFKRQVIAPLERFADHVISGEEIRSWIEATREELEAS